MTHYTPYDRHVSEAEDAHEHRMELLRERQAEEDAEDHRLQQLPRDTHGQRWQVGPLGAEPVE